MADEQRAWPPTRHVPSPNARQRSEALKERIYVTFTALAVAIAYERDTAHASVADAAFTLLLTVVGTLLAVFVADVLAHMVLAGALPTRAELAHLVYVSFGSLTVVVVPLALLGLSAIGLLAVATALRAIVVTLSATLVVVGLFAVRRLHAEPVQKLLVLAGVSVLGLAALVVELSVH